MKNTNDNLISNTLKADLLLSDYALATKQEDKDTILELLGRYIYDLDDNKATFLYSKICDSCISDTDLYVEILMDHLTTIKSNISNMICA